MKGKFKLQPTPPTASNLGTEQTNKQTNALALLASPLQTLGFGEDNLHF